MRKIAIFLFLSALTVPAWAGFQQNNVNTGNGGNQPVTTALAFSQEALYSVCQAIMITICSAIPQETFL